MAVSVSPFSLALRLDSWSELREIGYYLVNAYRTLNYIICKPLLRILIGMDLHLLSLTTWDIVQLRAVIVRTVERSVLIGAIIYEHVKPQKNRRHCKDTYCRRTSTASELAGCYYRSLHRDEKSIPCGMGCPKSFVRRARFWLRLAVSMGRWYPHATFF